MVLTINAFCMVIQKIYKYGMSSSELDHHKDMSNVNLKARVSLLWLSTFRDYTWGGKECFVTYESDYLFTARHAFIAQCEETCAVADWKHGVSFDMACVRVIIREVCWQFVVKIRTQLISIRLLNTLTKGEQLKFFVFDWKTDLGFFSLSIKIVKL